MIIDEIKNANVQAMKEKDALARAIYGIVMSKYMQVTIEARAQGNEVGDAEMVKVIQKTIKELTEEEENYKRVGNMEEANNIGKQKSLLEKYLPQLLTDSEIRNIIASLEDKTVPSVMRHFKMNYNGKCDMKLVSTVLKEFN